MKLLIILAIKEYQEELRQLLNHSGVSIYSEVDLRGYKSDLGSADPMNWFAAQADPDTSLMILAFMQQEESEKIIGKLKEFNQKHEGIRPSHAFQIPVEKFI